MSITKSKPFYAVAGAGDLAVKALREVPTRLATLRVDRKDIESKITTLQVETKALPAKAQTAAVGVVGGVADTADALYGDLVSRGRSIVTRIRRQQATQDLESQANTTVRRTKGAATTARKSAADTRKGAAATVTAAKSATTSASETAEQAVEAVGDGAAKVGA